MLHEILFRKDSPFLYPSLGRPLVQAHVKESVRFRPNSYEARTAIGPYLKCFGEISFFML